MTVTPAQIAKAALRRLALERLEPTPENYARAWAEEGGAAAPALPARARAVVERLAQRACDDAAQRAELVAGLLEGRWDDAQRLVERLDAGRGWAALIERVARGVERGGRHWTNARRKDSLQRVLDGSRHDAQRLQQRLQQLVTSWEHDSVDDPVDTGIDPMLDLAEPPAAPTANAASSVASLVPDAPPARCAAAPTADAWPPVAQALECTVRAALPSDEPRPAALADELARLAARIADQGATPALAAAVGAVCERARRWLGHRHQLVEQLASLCRELTAGLADLAEDASWTQGQLRAVEARLDGGVNARSVKAAADLLAHTRAQQQRLRAERDRARDALRTLVEKLLAQLGEVDERTGGYGQRLERYEAQIREATSIDDLAGLVQRMLADNREVQAGVHATRERLRAEHARAAELESRVRALEDELRRLSDEVSTDALTEVANRRGLLQAFDIERSRVERAPVDAVPPLAVGLLDIDNFKKLNDTLGHAAGDVALKALAARVRDALRPSDTVGRWGGEEFVVLLPGTGVDEAQQVLTRLQRALSASLFLHEGQEVFVTFSAGVTAWRPGEAIDAALERADEALYEAKRTGKNRTCVA
ncbi:sensor domain-containing diguanylate cyclase [Azohydromonas sediminis]|uniref:GGDEF domain-containing protein n=1 Tax=Azohydromonas sediminis TaxID=2259674 RepID=UPI000E656AC1|nr:GGDEF domain-containing protein [Azohydromonas sediminis]